MLEKPRASSSGSRTARRRRCSTWRSTPTASAGCWASRSTGTSSSTPRSTCTGARARPAPTARPATPCRCSATALDRFHWDGTALTYEKTLHRGRALQDDVSNRTVPTTPVFRGNHNGGVVRVGPDGKLYLIVGDTGRRGQTQNLFDGPFVYPQWTGRRRGLDRRRPVRRPGHRLRAPDRRDPAPEHRRHRAQGQPVLPARRRARRPQRRGAAQDLRVRHPQQLRHGVRPLQRRPVGAGERRRLVLGDQPHRAGLQLRLGAGDGPA